jgi:heat shock protein HtpX
MVTMTLLQGVINAFVMFLARIIAYAIARGDSRERGGGMQFLVVLVLQFVLGISLAGRCWFSRQREFRGRCRRRASGRA